MARASSGDDFFATSREPEHLQHRWIVRLRSRPDSRRLLALNTDIKNVAAASLGANAPDPKADKLALGYVHNLSKRTALYANFACTKNKNGAALPPALPPSEVVGFTNRTLVNILDKGAGYRADTAYGYDFGILHGS